MLMAQLSQDNKNNSYSLRVADYILVIIWRYLLQFSLKETKIWKGYLNKWQNQFTPILSESKIYFFHDTLIFLCGLVDGWMMVRSLDQLLVF